VIPISLRPVISKMAQDRDSILTGTISLPTLYKSCKKFTWRIYALSERLLVVLFIVCDAITGYSVVDLKFFILIAAFYTFYCDYIISLFFCCLVISV